MVKLREWSEINHFTKSTVSARQTDTRTYGHKLSKRIHTIDVVATAPIVPVGIDFCASARSPDRFEPAMIPTIDDKLNQHASRE